MIDGLLGNFNPDQKSALVQGLLSAAGAGLSGRGSTIQAVGQGILGGVGGYQGALKNIQEERYNNVMLQGAQDRQNAARMAQEAAQRQQTYLRTGDAGGQGGGTPQYSFEGLVQAGFSPKDATSYLNRGGPEIKDIDPKDYTAESFARFATSRNPADLVAAREMKVAQNGQVYNPYGVSAGTVFADPNQPFSIGQNGQIMSNDPFQRFQLAKAHAGAARTNVNVTNKAAESIAGQVGPMLKDSQGEASAAIKSINAANSIDSALDTGNLYTGTGANQRLTIGQIADTLGVGGADQKEKLANTRQALQGLAQLTLQGRQQMRGQGAITDSESKLAERAISGDLSLTPAEIRVLTGSARRAGEFAYSEHQKRVRTLEGNPTLAPMVPFYSVPDLPQRQQAPAQQGQPGSIRRFNPETGRIE